VLRIVVRKAVMKMYEPAKQKKGRHWGRTHREITDIPQRKRDCKIYKVPPTEMAWGC
jgi:hypothetical protein